MRILHTSDWHVGKTLKGHSRSPDQIAALAAVVKVATEHRPDLVIVAGDLYESASPTADATRIVTRALSALRATGASVVAIGGNHDNGAALDALRPWADAAGIALRGTPRSAEDLILTGTTAAGEPWRLAALPFVSRRYAIRATEMFELSAAEATQTHADHIGRLLARLAESFVWDGRTVNLVAAHLTVVGARVGGGEREAQTILDYAVPATVFPAGTHYVALGHLHRAQPVSGPGPIRYSGCPLAVDFGESDLATSVSIVDVTAETAARVTEVPVTAGRPLRTVRGTVAELSGHDPGDALLRVFVAEPPRAGLREEVQELLPQALEVRIDPALLPNAPASTTGSSSRAGRGPGALFADYLAQAGHADEATLALFHQLHDEIRHP
ncbi:MAG: exonuclease SbcCD subunit D [Dactylosporangium sp.]|nr:exonuclease SbcCD subunit D [Dactylosporangium sp.]NNJ63881.1 exonuclease SbcCD subunit D [Dactylosporangium sp.]